jgi:hypothetical protein
MGYKEYRRIDGFIKTQIMYLNNYKKAIFPITKSIKL